MHSRFALDVRAIARNWKKTPFAYFVCDCAETIVVEQLLVVNWFVSMCVGILVICTFRVPRACMRPASVEHFVCIIGCWTYKTKDCYVCMYTQAICCDDGNHCCPPGSSCDAKTRMCQSDTNSLMFTWHQMSKQIVVAAAAESQVVAASVDCPDSSSCDDGQTCCKLTSGTYGCCPYTQVFTRLSL
jgi:hypothetical protein